MEGGFVEPWREEEEDLPNKTACKLLEAANEFDLAAILDATAWEVTGRTDGNFGKACGHRCLVVQSKTVGTGYDLSKREDTDKMIQECQQQPPWKVWISPSCVLPGGESMETAAWRKKQGKVRKAAGTRGAAGEGADPGEL